MYGFILVLGFALLSLGIAGLVASRHFVVMVLSVEIMLVASALVAMDAYGYFLGGGILPLLFVIWAIAAIDVIALMVFYRYLGKLKMSMDVTELSRLREE